MVSRVYPAMSEPRIAIVGLGYVGLPLAIEFGKIFNTVGFDTNKKRINQLKDGYDITLEVASSDFEKSSNLEFTNSSHDIESCDVYIVTVPTPVDQFHKPDLEPLINASKIIAPLLAAEDIVIYESTVYPGATEEICVPLLEEGSGLKYNENFFCGYSPERINPGDKKHRLTTIKKITSGSTKEIAEKVDNLYRSIITAGTHMAESIKVAEAAKVIENTQRDVNIALINELSMIFNRLGIDTEAVLNAAGTKWNFLPFTPGLVGGHCIGVDPYYLTHKAISIGYHPEMILAGRRINDSMGGYVAEQVSILMLKKHISVSSANILIMGLTFKENCPDIRNTGVLGVIESFERFNCTVDVYDPWVERSELTQKIDVNMVEKPERGKYEAIVICVAHKEFQALSSQEIRSYGAKNHVLYDVKHLLDISESDGRL